MDKKDLRQLIKDNAELRQYLQNPFIQQFLNQILEDEFRFDSLKVRFSSLPVYTPFNNSHQRIGHRNNYQKPYATAGFQNPNLSPLSPLEARFIEGRDSDELIKIFNF